MRRILIAGAGGFIGGHLAKRLARYPHEDVAIRAVDIKPISEWYQVCHGPNVENWCLDLSQQFACHQACRDVDVVFNLACNMGGMGFIELNRVACMQNTLVTLHLIDAAANAGVQEYFYASTACVYNADKQNDPNVVALKESDAYPAMPERGYGWEKLYGEEVAKEYLAERGLQTYIARFHNVYGPHGTWKGGKEKAPAALCRKIAQAKTGDTIEIWGDGEQTRSFMFIDDCIEGILRITGNDALLGVPVNLGSSELVSINQLVSIIEEIAGKKLERKYNLTAPQGVRGRSSDNTFIQEVLQWSPSTSLWGGLTPTYQWIKEQVERDMVQK